MDIGFLNFFTGYRNRLVISGYWFFGFYRMMDGLLDLDGLSGSWTILLDLDGLSGFSTILLDFETVIHQDKGSKKRKKEVD